MRLTLLLACAAPDSAPPPTTDTTPTDTSPTDTSPTDDTATPPDPFAAQPDTSEGLVNLSADLDALLERGALVGACDAWRADPADRRKELLCGKSMFFYETFGTSGVPRSLLEFESANFPDELGYGFSRLGLIEDPESEARLPLGLAPSEPAGTTETLAFTCASCHLAQLPDGRYAVGGANLAFDYGKLNLHLVLLPTLAIPGANPDDHDPAAVAVVQDVLTRLQGDTSLQWDFLGVLIDLLGVGEVPAFSVESEGHYAAWAPGTMDFFIEPLPVDDRVHTVSKVSSLWGIPTSEEAAAAGMANAMLGWTGNTTTLTHFCQLFGTMGGGYTPSEADVQPLVHYIESLRAPEVAETDVSTGEALFAEKGCLGCHGGPRGSGLRVYTYDEVGTDSALARWMDPELDGVPCCDADMTEDPLTHGVKSPRLTGIATTTRFLHNGSVTSLERLFCLDGDRPTTTEEAYGDQGHRYTCDGLADDEKRALIAYLEAH